MSNKMEEVSKDIAELRTLVASATRKRIQDILSLELKRLETELKNLEDSADNKSETPKAKTNLTPKIYTVNIRNYSWDQSDKFVKLYITLKNVHSMEKDKISVKFDIRSVNLHVSELDSKNHQLNILKLAEDIKPDASYHKIKTDMVVLFLAKEKQMKWEGVTELEARSAEARKPKHDSNDPNAGIMDLMKQMYVDGDDKMKQMLNKTWYESQQKRMSGEAGAADMMPDLNL
ncbi:calcyclin-binding protein-like [Penaeus japonicus]|uniref:calcyclin-binding protein-like n=1 Tax=Penaeus japonicus TaxID=27405 RepID=UPI001C71543B|nr:calcyclin-binding protein-like [Penaeus japonicus]